MAYNATYISSEILLFLSFYWGGFIKLDWRRLYNYVFFLILKQTKFHGHVLKFLMQLNISWLPVSKPSVLLEIPVKSIFFPDSFHLAIEK